MENEHEPDVVEDVDKDQVQCTCPICGGQYPVNLLAYHACSCGESAPENLPSTSSNSDIRGRPQRSREVCDSISTPDLDAERMGMDTHEGDAAVGVGVQRHVLSLAMSKLQHGFDIKSDVTDITLLLEGEPDHLLPSTSRTLLESDLFTVAGRMIGHSFLHGGPALNGISEAVIHMLIYGGLDTATITLADVADLDLQEIIAMLDGDEVLSDQQRDEINSLALSWDLPSVNASNRRWLFQQMMQHAVIGRRTKQIKQIKKGLKDTKVIASREARDSWSNISSLCYYSAYFPASPSHLSQLTKFWIGWEIPAGEMKIKVVEGEFLKSSTCFATLQVPGHFHNYEDFSKHVESCIATYVTGFGLV